MVDCEVCLTWTEAALFGEDLDNSCVCALGLLIVKGDFGRTGVKWYRSMNCGFESDFRMG